MSAIIGTPIIIASLNLQVAENDFPLPVTSNNATSLCNNLGVGWRLPTKIELDVMIHRFPNLREKYYWSSIPEDGYNYDTYLVYENLGVEYPFTDFYDAKAIDARFYVRAVFSPAPTPP